MLCDVNRRLFFHLTVGIMPSREAEALPAYTTSAPASRGAGGGGGREGVSLLSAQIRGFWGGQHDCRTGPGPEGLVLQVRSWETRALPRRVDGGGRRASGRRVGRLPPQLCCWGWKWSPLSSCLSGKGRRAGAVIYTTDVFQPESWISQLSKATRPPFFRCSFFRLMLHWYNLLRLNTQYSEQLTDSLFSPPFTVSCAKTNL